MWEIVKRLGRQGRHIVSAFIATAFAQVDAEAARTQCKIVYRLRPNCDDIGVCEFATFGLGCAPPACKRHERSTLISQIGMVCPLRNVPSWTRLEPLELGTTWYGPAGLCSATRC